MKTAQSFLVSVVIGMSSIAAAGEIQWSGNYRAEGVYIQNQDLAVNSEDSFLLHHLALKGKIIPHDSFSIFTRFDIFNNSLPNNQMGQTFGQYATTTTAPTATNAQVVDDETLRVTQLYLNWRNEFSQLTVGRAPFEFGLGLKFDAGNDLFDHYFTTKDMVAYKIVAGNFSITPAYGKQREGDLIQGDDINDYIFVIDYHNLETDLSMGFLYDHRVAPISGVAAVNNGNDFPTTVATNGTREATFSVYNMNLYVKKEYENLNIGIEAGFNRGDTGVRSNGSKIEMAGFGVAGEAQYRTGDWTFDLKTGLASGDNADTNEYEGYWFNNNYQVAMLMFHYPMGQYDVLQSSLSGSQLGGGLPTEVISNAIYVAPKATLAVGEKTDLYGSFIYGVTHQKSLSAANVSKDLGFEIDLGLRMQPTEKISLLTEFGVLLPGDAFKGDPSSPYDAKTAYGANIKAAISF